MRKNKFAADYKFRGELWRHDGGWCFITLPIGASKKIRSIHADSEEGWGRLKATATIGETCWQTSIWFDTKAGSYLLPLKLSIRKKEKLAIGQVYSVSLSFSS